MPASVHAADAPRVVGSCNSSGNTLRIFLRLRIRGWRLSSLFLLGALSASCVGAHAVVRRETAELRVEWRAAISWFTTAAVDDDLILASWRHAVGPPVVGNGTRTAPAVANGLTVVSWNIANGGGQVLRLAERLPADMPIVLLLQEAYRGGPEVPTALRAGASFAARLGGARAGPDSRDVKAIASALNLNIYYVPSMRNGGIASDEDRGNAILSSLPLTDLAAVELPFERQRRVAIAATVHGTTISGRPWHVRVASIHLDNTAGFRRGWIGGEYGRARQARAVRDVLGDDGPVVLGGDFNTWFGFSEQAYLETLLAFPDTEVTDSRPTFRGLLRLDHMFFRLPSGWRASFRRADDRLGSDHFPLVGTVQFGERMRDASPDGTH